MTMKAVFLMTSAALVLASCGDSNYGGGVTVVSGGTTGSTPTPSPATPAPTPASSLGADGWAATGTGTTGGDGAVAAKTYTVTNRNELIQALYGNTATIAADGSYTGTLDPAKKLIYVKGQISLNMNQALTEQTADDYIKGSCASTTYGFTAEAALTTAYLAAYRPSVYGNASLPVGNPENARVCAAALQKKVVQIFVPSNTSIIGLGSDAKLVHGNLILGTSSAPIDNVVVRNITFEDAFDFFPQWDPTDSTTGRWNSAYDLISVLYATHVWIDHSTFSDGARIDRLYPSVWTETVGAVNYTGSDFKVQHHDGLIDVTKLGNLVTISKSYFFGHDKSFLIGGTDTASKTAENPSVLKVTFHDNYFQGLRQRMPRVRFGQVHVYNNYYEVSLDPTADEPFLVAWTVGQSGKIIAENNAIITPGTAGTVSNLWSISVSAARTSGCITTGYTADDCASTFADSGTQLNGVTVDVTTPLRASNAAVAASTWSPAANYSYVLKPTTGLIGTVIANAGAGKL
ncbi:pectate lyase [Sphingomonas sp. TF3]|uniref:polysaccharide lyase family 1 protein n=1 Tax=Sphingomonas sp. TF3 TaxID=2495580 RepID=UPI000F882D2F|nr:pectate lyase [Sphingomonas sp. TF3]RUN78112.1 pectate lyase [Sphingomonas sp. TF3]